MAEELGFLTSGSYSWQDDPLLRELPRNLAWVVAAFGVGTGVARVGASFSIRRVLGHWHLGVLLAGFVVAAVLVPVPVDLHEHLSFLARADCAVTLECDSDPRGPAWGAPAFHVYGVLLRLFPYRTPVPGMVSLAVTVGALILLYALVLRLVEPARGPKTAWRLAFTSVAVLVVNPAFLRVSVAGSLWPYAMVCLLAAGVALLDALREGRATSAGCSSAWFTLAILGNRSFLLLVPLALLAPLCWRRDSRRPRPAVWLAVAAPPVLLHAELAEGVRELVQRVGQRAMELSDLRQAQAILAEPGVTPLPVVLAFWLGVPVALRVWRRSLPLLFALGALLPVMGMQGGTLLGADYPVAFLNYFPTLFFQAPVAALGVEVLGSATPARVRSHVPVGFVLLALAFLPWCRDGVELLVRRRVVEREFLFIVRHLPHLPPHDHLVVGDGLQPALAKSNGDPVEVWFPVEEYRYVRRSAGEHRSSVLRVDKLAVTHLEGRVLFYLGSAMRSFTRGETAAGYAAAGDRPALLEVKRRFHLEPVITVDLETEQHPSVGARLGGDLHPTVTLGFYWLSPRTSGEGVPAAAPRSGRPGGDAPPSPEVAPAPAASAGVSR